MNLEFRWVDASCIDVDDTTFCVRSQYPKELAESMRTSGVRVPLLLQERARGCFRIVSGWRRWRALQTLQERNQKGTASGPAAEAVVPAFLVPANENDGACWDRFLRDNEGTFGVLEVACILDCLRRSRLEEETIVRDKMPLLGLRPSVELFRQHLRLLDLGQRAREFIETTRVPLRRAVAFLKFAPDASDAVADAAVSLRLNLNELSETLTLLEEVAHRDDEAPEQVLQSALGGR